MNYFDYFIVAITLLFSFNSFVKGAVREFLSFGFLLGAFYCSSFFSSSLHHSFVIIKNPYYNKIFLHLAIFVVAYMVGNILSSFLASFINKGGSSSFDKILGFGIGFAKGTFFISLLLIGLDFFPVAKIFPKYSFFKSKSLLLPYFDPLIDLIKSFFVFFDFQVL